MKTGKCALWISLAVFLVFAAFTAVIMTVDVRPIGPEGTKVGLAALNGCVSSAIGYHEDWYKLSEITGAFSLITAAAFALWTLGQMIRRKGVLRADRRLLLLMAFYALVAVLYVLFDLLAINFRPVVLDEGIEPSYPSSHTMLALCVMITAVFQLRVRLADKKLLRSTSVCACVLLLLLTVVGRFLSGVHWITDIIGSFLLSGALIFLYLGLLAFLQKPCRKEGSC